MSLVIDLAPGVESRLEQEAAKKGFEPSEYAGRLIENGLPAQVTERQQSILAMLDAWDAEDETDDPVEIAARQAEWEEFKESINRHHESDRIIYP